LVLVFVTLITGHEVGLAQKFPDPNQDVGASAEKAQALAKSLDEADRTIWGKELEAQRHEAEIIEVWDRLRKTPISKRHEIFAALDVEKIILGKLAEQRKLEMGVTETGSAPGKAHDLQQWRQWLFAMHAAGHRIVQSEWHHSGFTPGEEGAPDRSEVNYELHLGNELHPNRFAILKGALEITWRRGPELHARPVPAIIDASRFTILQREGAPPFRRSLRIAPKPAKPGGPVTLGPVVVHDLNGDGLPEIILGWVNQLLWNRGRLKFQETKLFRESPRAMGGAACVADFTGDGHLDFLGVDDEGRAWLLAGTKNGAFAADGTRAWREIAKMPSAMTAGDVDRDGDLDIWLTQYKDPYTGGQMPTPFYDANDGHPSHLFINDGKGNFTDGTAAAGLAAKRFRRSFSASLVDLDDDRDLDLIVVSDFAGLDAYLNDGKGRFRDATSELFEERAGFGMSHVFGDFDRDGREDLFMAGMSSTTARRLDQLGLQREDFPEYAKKRAAMAFGNRVFQRRDGKFVQTALNAGCARAGWAWGTAGFDLENDGDDDLYVANGHMSGESARDYCTCFWRRDIYAGSSQEDPVTSRLLSDEFRPVELRGLGAGKISWNGFEHNRLFLNLAGREFVDAGYLFGVSYETDCRAVVTADLDADGRRDLLVVEHRRNKAMKPVQSLMIHRNVAPGDNHWLGVRLAGDSTVSPIGAKVEVRGRFGTRERRIANGDSFAAQHPPVAHFGLGEHDRVDRIVVTWPDGRVSERKEVFVDNYLELRPPPRSSPAPKDGRKR